MSDVLRIFNFTFLVCSGFAPNSSHLCLMIPVVLYERGKQNFETTNKWSSYKIICNKIKPFGYKIFIEVGTPENVRSEMRTQ